jgi:hypothetical protein
MGVLAGSLVWNVVFDRTTVKPNTEAGNLNGNISRCLMLAVTFWGCCAAARWRPLPSRW